MHIHILEYASDGQTIIGGWEVTIGARGSVLHDYDLSQVEKRLQ
jgi:hypothetical protein